MQPILKLYIKAFLITGLTFAMLMAIPEYFDGQAFSIGKFLFHAIFFGGGISLTLVSMHKSNLKHLGIANPSEDNLKAVQKNEFVSTVSRDDFISRVSKDDMMSKMKLVENEDTLNLSSALTWKSWGERIVIKISSASEGMFKYHVQSKPKFPLTLMDFGKNLENIRLIQNLANGIE